MSGLQDDTVIEGHDLINNAELEAKADPEDFQKVHRVGETGGSILSDKPGASASSASGESTGSKHGSAAQTLEAKLAALREKMNTKK